VRTTDPSADGRRSAASRTAIGGGISSRRPRGDNLFYCLFVLYVQQGHAVHCRFRPRHPPHSGLDQSRPPSRRRRDQYCAAGALACTRRRSDVTRCSGIDMTSPCGQLCADVTSAVKPEVHNVSLCCQGSVHRLKFGKDCACSPGDMRADRHTNRHGHRTNFISYSCNTK